MESRSRGVLDRPVKPDDDSSVDKRSADESKSRHSRISEFQLRDEEQTGAFRFAVTVERVYR